MQIRLHIVPAQGRPYDHRPEGESLVIGRSSGSDLVLPDRFLSRKHSRLFLSNEQWYLEDLGSRNGTLLNGSPVTEPTPLRPGDVIKISGSVISLYEPGSRPGASAGIAELLPQVAVPTALGADATIFKKASDLLEQGPASSTNLDSEVALRKYADRITLLNGVHRALGRSLSRDQLLELILERVFDHLRPEQGAIHLKDATGELTAAATRSAPGKTKLEVVSTSLANEVAEKGLAALVLDVESDERFNAAQSMLGSGIRSLVAAPLLADEEILGMIVLSSQVMVRKFSEEDLELLVSLASIAALWLRNLALADEAAERRRLEAELALGRRIQVALLPDTIPQPEGFVVYGGNSPSRGVSGDFFEVVERPGAGECVLMVADVSGKGIAASLLTASLEALSAGPIEDGLAPEEICARLSRQLYRRTPPEKYATGFLATLNTQDGYLDYTNAGHNPGLLVSRDGSVENLEATGAPIGLLPEAFYTSSRTRLTAGDTLVLYTDGLTEAEDPQEEEYGLDRLIAVCREHRTLDLEALGAAIHRDLERFVDGVPFADDRTLVMVRRLDSA